MSRERQVLVEVGTVRYFLGAVDICLSQIAGLEGCRENLGKALDACDRINQILVNESVMAVPSPTTTSDEPGGER